jgi:hypothetical protein
MSRDRGIASECCPPMTVYNSLAFGRSAACVLRTTTAGRPFSERFPAMPKPFRLFSTRPLPPDAELVEHDGRPHLRLKERGRTVYYPLTKDGKGYLKPSKCWYFKYRDANGIVRRRKGFSDLKATEQLAIETERKVARQRLGYADPVEEHATRPLVDHLADYAAYLEAKGDTSAHVKLTISRIRAVLDGCGFTFPRDLDANTVSAWLTTLRRDGTPVALPDRADFTSGEVADLLGITGAALRAAVKRLNLPATGNGKARRLPRSAVETLVTERSEGDFTGNREPLRPRPSRVRPLAAEVEADRIEPARNLDAAEHRCRHPPPTPGTDRR